MTTDAKFSQGSRTTFSGAEALAAVFLTLLSYFHGRQILHSLGLFGVRLAEEERDALERELRFEERKRRLQDELTLEQANLTSKASELTRQLDMVTAAAERMRAERKWREKWRSQGWAAQAVGAWVRTAWEGVVEVVGAGVVWAVGPLRRWRERVRRRGVEA
ncbi:MAG: hypothetical protein Q9216_005201 [Gyalolechia sp. 2 TL-2023]